MTRASRIMTSFLLRRLSMADKARGILLKKIKAVAVVYEALAKKWIRDGHYDTWEEVSKIKGKATDTGSWDITSGISSNTWQAIINQFGRGAGKTPPPLDTLVWRSIRTFGLSGTKTGSYDEQPRETKQVIRWVARAIGKKGIKKLELYTNIADKNIAILQRAFINS